MQKSTAAGLPNSQFGMRICLPCFMTQAVTSFKLCTQTCMLAELKKKGVSDSVLARNHVRVIFTRQGIHGDQNDPKNGAHIEDRADLDSQESLTTI